MDRSYNRHGLNSFVGGILSAFFYDLLIFEVIAIVEGVAGITTHVHEKQKARWMARVGLPLGVLYLAMFLFYRPGMIGPARRPTAEELAGILNSPEYRRVIEIIKTVVIDPDMPTKAVRDEFWFLVKGMGEAHGTPLTENDIDSLRGAFDTVVGVGLTYQRLFWEDALRAQRSGRPVRSQARSAYEAFLLERRFATAERIRQNNLLIASVAAGEPIQVQGESAVFDAEMIGAIIANLDAGFQRLESLYRWQ